MSYKYMNLRNYMIGDEKQVLELVTTVLSEYGLKIDPQTTDKDLENIQESYIDNGGVFKVVEHKNQIVGSYGLFYTSKTTCELTKMYLQKEHRGLGLGKMMLIDAIYEAKNLGFTCIILETNSVLWEAVRLYENHGFVYYQAEHLSDRCDCAMKLDLN